MNGIMRQFMPYARKQAGLYALSFAGSLFRFLIPLAVPMAIKFVFDGLLQHHGMPYEDKLRQLLLLSAAVLAALFLIRGPMEYVRQYFLHKANNNMVRELRLDAFRKVHELDAKELADRRSGEIGARFFDDVEKIRGYLTAAFSNVWIEMVVLGVVIGIMLSLHAPLALVAMLLVAAQFALAHLLSKRFKRATKEMMGYRSVLTGFIFEKIQGALVSKLFAGEGRDTKELRGHLQRYDRITDRQARINALTLSSVNVLADATPFVVVLAGSALVLDGQLTAGALIAFFAYVDRMRGPVSALVQAFPAIAEGSVALQRLFDFLNTPSRVKEAAGAIDAGHFAAAVEFRDVRFAYAPEREVLRGVGFTLEKGKTYAFVGESGGGKSTVLQLLTRMYDAASGEVLLDGRDVRSLSLASLRRLIGAATQDSFLYSSSIRDNIRIGKPEATDAEVEAAARQAFAHDFICALPNGYDTAVGERGVKLSGGQRQRIALARVFLKDAPLLLLDEATSALDNESEQLVLRAIRGMGQDRTVVMVAHRLSTVVHADTIFVLRDGRIAEQGSHRELLDAGGYYRELYMEQRREEAETQAEGPARRADASEPAIAAAKPPAAAASA